MLVPASNDKGHKEFKAKQKREGAEKQQGKRDMPKPPLVLNKRNK